MFVNEILTSPRYVDGRKFIERTINSKFGKADVTITTVYMNDKPILKQYVFDMPDKIMNFWKTLKERPKVTGCVVEKNLDVIV